MVASIIQGLIALNVENYVWQSYHGTLLTIAVLAFSVIFNTSMSSYLPMIEGIILVLHVTGILAITIPLWALTPDRSLASCFAAENTIDISHTENQSDNHEERHCGVRYYRPHDRSGDSYRSILNFLSYQRLNVSMLCSSGKIISESIGAIENSPNPIQAMSSSSDPQNVRSALLMFGINRKIESYTCEWSSQTRLKHP